PCSASAITRKRGAFSCLPALPGKVSRESTSNSASMNLFTKTLCMDSISETSGDHAAGPSVERRGVQEEDEARCGSGKSARNSSAMQLHRENTNKRPLLQALINDCSESLQAWRCGSPTPFQT